MQLKMTTDYALRTVIHLATVGRIAPSSEISEKMKIPRKYLINIVRGLRESGIINTHSGASGGYSLAKKPEDISLYDIISVMEGSINISKCLDDDEVCTCYQTEVCPVRRSYYVIQDGITKHLKSYSIKDILNTNLNGNGEEL